MRKASALARPARSGLRVEQRELVGEQVVDAGVRLAVVEQAADRVAGAGRGLKRRAVLPEPPVAGERLGARHGEQVAAALVEHELEAENGSRRPPKRDFGAARPSDRAHPAALRPIEVQDPVGLAVAHRAEPVASVLRSPRRGAS